MSWSVKAVVAAACVLLVPFVPVTRAQRQATALDVGLSLLEQGQAGQAVPLLEQAVASDPNSLAAQNGLGLAFASVGRAAEAVAAFRKALEISSDDSRVWNNLAFLYFSNRRFDDAVAAYERAVRSDPNSPIAHQGLGNTYLSLGQAEKAIASLTTAVNLSPEYALALGNLACALNLAGRHDEAVVAARRSLMVDVTQAPVHYSLGLAYGKLGFGPGAQVELEWLAANAPALAAQLQQDLAGVDLSGGRRAAPAAPPERDRSAMLIDAGDTPHQDFVQESGPGITLLGETAPKSALPDGWQGGTLGVRGVPQEDGGLMPEMIIKPIGED